MTDDTSNGNDQQEDDGKSYLPLSVVARWVAPSTLAFLEEGEAKKKQIQAEIDQDEAGYANFLFAQEEKLRGLENEKGEMEPADASQVMRWASSPTNPDGITGMLSSPKSTEEGAVNTIYVLSGEALAGFGDQVWASSRHISNLLANADTCVDTLSPLIQRLSPSEQDALSDKFPMVGMSFLELGAGAGVPSWTAMRIGARVICTDQAVSDRIRSIAECVERNYQEMAEEILNKDDERLVHASKARAYPYNWGEDGNDILNALNETGQEKFDVIVGADCVYMPWLHPELLKSFDLLLSDRGVGFLPFALHENAPDEEVWGVAEMARDMGFVVDILEDAQLTPQKSCMEAKQGLVHTVRISRKS